MVAVIEVLRPRARFRTFSRWLAKARSSRKACWGAAAKFTVIRVEAELAYVATWLPRKAKKEGVEPKDGRLQGAALFAECVDG